MQVFSHLNTHTHTQNRHKNVIIFFKKKGKENQETNKVYETYQNYTAREEEAKKALICTTKLNFLGLSYIIFFKKKLCDFGLSFIQKCQQT